MMKQRAATAQPDRYRLIRRLDGDTGRAWLGRDNLLHRDVVLRPMQPAEWSLTSPEDAGTHMAKALAAESLDDPHLPKVYGVAREDGQPWIVMEFVPATCLQNVVGRRGPLRPEEVARIGREVLRALMVLHEHGLRHDAVNPRNVLLADDGRVLLSWAFDIDLRYAAPEQVKYGTKLAGTDLWALGAMLYEAVEGRHPFQRPTAAEMFLAVQTGEADPLRRAGQQLTPVLTGLLRRDPRQRMCAQAAAEAFEHAPAAPPPKRRRWLWGGR
jgi:serine/threonine protein kinase